MCESFTHRNDVIAKSLTVVNSLRNTNLPAVMLTSVTCIYYLCFLWSDLIPESHWLDGKRLKSHGPATQSSAWKTRKCFIVIVSNCVYNPRYLVWFFNSDIFLLRSSNQLIIPDDDIRLDEKTFALTVDNVMRCMWQFTALPAALSISTYIVVNGGKERRGIVPY